MEELKKEQRPEIEKPRERVEEKRKSNKPRPQCIEEKIDFIIKVSTDKKSLLELRKILVELEFNDAIKEERKEIEENDKRKIRRR